MNFLDVNFPEVTEAYNGSLEDWLELFERYAFPRTGDTETSTEMQRIFKRYTEITYEDWLDIVIKCARDEIWYEKKINLSIRELYLVVNKVARISEKLRATYTRLSNNSLLSVFEEPGTLSELIESNTPNVGKVNPAKVALFNWLANTLNKQDLIKFFKDPALVFTAESFNNSPVASKFNLAFEDLLNAAKTYSPCVASSSGWMSINAAISDLKDKKGIYAIKHIETNRVYIGQTTENFSARTKKHFLANRKDSTFHALIEKLGGMAAFELKVLVDMSSCSRDAILREEETLAKAPFNNLLDFNCREGGYGGAVGKLTDSDLTCLLKIFLEAASLKVRKTYPQLLQDFKAQTGFEDFSIDSLWTYDRCYTAAGYNRSGADYARDCFNRIISDRSDPALNALIEKHSAFFIDKSSITLSGNLVIDRPTYQCLFVPWKAFAENATYRDKLFDLIEAGKPVDPSELAQGIIYYSSAERAKKLGFYGGAANSNPRTKLRIDEENVDVWHDLFDDIEVSIADFKFVKDLFKYLNSIGAYQTHQTFVEAVNDNPNICLIKGTYILIHIKCIPAK